MAKHSYNTDIDYNYGSAAPDVYREVYVPRAPGTREISTSRRQRKYEKLEVLKRRFVFVVGTLAVFVSSGLFVWGCAIVSAKQYDLKQVKVEVRELKSQVNTKKALIASATNLDHIKLRAMNELKMAEPLAHQITYLDIKKTSYTVVDKAPKEEGDRGW